jgi:hypothetical protein
MNGGFGKMVPLQRGKESGITYFRGIGHQKSLAQVFPEFTCGHWFKRAPYDWQ